MIHNKKDNLYSTVDRHFLEVGLSSKYSKA